jgi:thiosulfate reductase cytochrome b subunit
MDTSVLLEMWQLLLLPVMLQSAAFRCWKVFHQVNYQQIYTAVLSTWQSDWNNSTKQ